MAKRVWTYVGGRAGNKPPPGEKAAISAACERLIAEVLRPRFLPKIRPRAAFNYPVAIEGKWLGNRYRFFTRCRSDDPASLQAEFDAPFARLDYVSRDCFDLMWHRHTDEWHRVSERLSLTEALHGIESEPYSNRVDLTTGIAPTRGQLIAAPEDVACRANPPHWRCA